jgi:hypothetical protein
MQYHLYQKGEKKRERERGLSSNKIISLDCRRRRRRRRRNSISINFNLTTAQTAHTQNNRVEPVPISLPPPLPDCTLTHSLTPYLCMPSSPPTHHYNNTFLFSMFYFNFYLIVDLL